MSEFNEIMSYLLPAKKDIRLRRVTIVGEPEAGKTNLAFYLAQRIIEERGEDKVNVVYTKRLKDAIKYMDQKPYQLLLIDDAVRYQYSRVSVTKEGRIQIADFYEIRHVYRKMQNMKKSATITIIFITQRWRDLAPQYRNAPVVFFKSVLTDPDDRRLMLKMIGPEYFNILQDITRRIFALSDDRAKGEAVITTSWGNKYHLRGIPIAERHFELIESEEKPEDIIDELADELLDHFQEKTLYLPVSILRGYLRTYAIKEGIDTVFLDAIDVAKYRAYKMFGWGIEGIVDRAEYPEIINKLLEGPLDFDDTEYMIGRILSIDSRLSISEAKKLIKIAYARAKEKGLIKEDKDWVTLEEAALLLGVTKRTIWNYIRDGLIIQRKYKGRKIVVRKSEILDLASELGIKTNCEV